MRTGPIGRNRYAPGRVLDVARADPGLRELLLRWERGELCWEGFLQAVVLELAPRAGVAPRGVELQS